MWESIPHSNPAELDKLSALMGLVSNIGRVVLSTPSILFSVWPKATTASFDEKDSKHCHRGEERCDV